MKLIRRCKQASIQLGQTGSVGRFLLISVFLVFGIIGSFRLVGSHASAAGPRIVSGISGFCLDDRDSSVKSDAVADVWKCNNTAAQVWSVDGINITHNGDNCLSVLANSSVVSSKVVLSPCSDAAGQVWLRDKAGYMNPNSNMCLAAASDASGAQLVIADCNLSSSREIWTPTQISNPSGYNSASCSTYEGARVACYAEKEWTTWQSGAPGHETLLNSYTDGAPYEEWCADFVSYVYREAGFPFTQGESDGWDENNANNIQNMGFDLHPASSGYVPKPGDVAYFNYQSGHVEIVISGGKTPTFIYGNSATIDPSTGNGEMMANTITNDSGEGQLVYYLSPN